MPVEYELIRSIGTVSRAERKKVGVLRTDAQLYRQERVGGPTSTASAGKILYWRQHNRVDVQDARYLDFDQLGGGNLPNVPF